MAEINCRYCKNIHFVQDGCEEHIKCDANSFYMSEAECYCNTCDVFVSQDVEDEDERKEKCKFRRVIQ